MNSIEGNRNPVAATAGTTILLTCLSGGVILPVSAADEPLAFDDRFRLRIASYNIRDADTDIAVANSSSGIGVAYSFTEDLGGDDKVTVPRIDAYYRFSDAHRIDFTTFEFDRDGREILKLDVDLGEESFNIGDTLVTDITYKLFKVAYGYSFYRNDQIELGVSAGLHVTSYNFDFELASGAQDESADATGPLPMFGLFLSYAMTPKWSLHFLTESFYIEIDDALDGSFTTNEVDIEYRFNEQFTLGAGYSRFGTDLRADDSDWKGGIADNHRGLLIYAAFTL